MSRNDSSGAPRLRHRIPPVAGLLLAVAAPLGAQRPDSAAVPRVTVPGGPQADSARGVRVCVGGDVTLGTNLARIEARPEVLPVRGAARRAARGARGATRADTIWHLDTIPSRWTLPPAPLLEPLRPLVRDADVLLLNVEGAIGEGRAASKCSPRSTMCFAFRMPPASAAAMRALGARGPGDTAAVVGNVANNHARDAGPAGFDSTVAQLSRAGVVATGADTLAAIAVTAAGDTVAFLGFATSGPGTPDVRELAAVRRHVARAAARHARLVVTMHMGAEGFAAQRTRDSVELFLGSSRGNPVAFARTVIDAGADFVVGHGPHVMRAAEWRGDVPVFYSLGNLVTYGPFSNKPPLDRGALACAVLDAKGRASEVELRPTVQRAPGFVAPDETRRAAALVDSLSRLDFPATGARVLPDGRVVRREGPLTSRRGGANAASRQAAGGGAP